MGTLQCTGGEPYFYLGIAGDGSTGRVSLRYYSSRLRRTYTATDWKPFTPSISPTQDGKPYVIKFMEP